MIDYALLKSELTSDPLGLGYAGKSPADQAAILNATTGPGAAAVDRRAVPVTDPAAVALIAYALVQIHGLTSATLVTYYLTMISTLTGIGFIQADDANVRAAMALAVQDGVITSTLAQVLRQKTGSRAEVLFGDGVTVAWPDIIKAES